MEADKQEQELLHRALDEWTRQGLLTGEQAGRLRDAIVPKQSGREQLAHYFFVIAITCALLAFGALFIDEKLLQRLQRFFLLQNLTIAIASALLSVACFWLVQRRRSRISSGSYELYLIPGGLTALISLVYFCKDIGNGEAYSLFLGLAALLFIALSLAFRSGLFWIMFLLASMGWFGAFSEAHSAQNMFLGMNYPVRFCLFGLLVLALSFAQRSVPRLQPYRRITYHAGLLLLFTALWGLSVFGNYGHLDEWAAVRQTSVLGYAVLFGAAAGLGLFLGIRHNDAPARDYSILFLLLNLYTRYFEYFWNSMNKGLFFLFLALSFWLVGRWLVRRNRTPAGAAHNGRFHG